ncbi:hypothetical protein DLJ53_28425 [Acuticoccus sediminis]|uniref:TRAP transporter small permease protein n=1 Tax=Acuticoccus sediminis TaxID=2184697 RepID=A0A8B2NFJ0_9HYPH|nr:TRAP transporter small permease [Acuticoccus sediminis]RAH97768.1 hypothetical protein DLJ53_28425 [Acuticoccus sediminis]
MTPTRLDRIVGTLSRWSARLGGAVVLACALLVAAEVILRNLPGGMPEGIRLHSFDLTNYGYAAAVAFGFSYALTERAHIRIDVLYALMPLALRAILDVFALVCLAATAATMAWYAWDVAMRSAAMGAMPNSTLRLPLAIPQSIWAAGLTWFAIVATLLTVQALVQLARGRIRQVHESTGVVREGEGL